MTGPAEPAPDKVPPQQVADNSAEVEEVPSQVTESQVKASNEAIPADKAQFEEAKGSLAVMTTGDATTQDKDKKLLGGLELVGEDPTKKDAKSTADGTGVADNGDRQAAAQQGDKTQTGQATTTDQTQPNFKVVDQKGNVVRELSSEESDWIRTHSQKNVVDADLKRNGGALSDNIASQLLKPYQQSKQFEQQKTQHDATAETRQPAKPGDIVTIQPAGDTTTKVDPRTVVRDTKIAQTTQQQKSGEYVPPTGTEQQQKVQGQEVQTGQNGSTRDRTAEMQAILDHVNNQQDAPVKPTTRSLVPETVDAEVKPPQDAPISGPTARQPLNRLDVEPTQQGYNAMNMPGFAELWAGHQIKSEQTAKFDENIDIESRVQTSKERNDKNQTTYAYTGELDTGTGGVAALVSDGDTAFTATETLSQSGQLESRNVKYAKPLEVNVLSPDGPQKLKDVTEATTRYDAERDKYITTLKTASGNEYEAINDRDGKVEKFSQSLEHLTVKDAKGNERDMYVAKGGDKQVVNRAEDESGNLWQREGNTRNWTRVDQQGNKIEGAQPSTFSGDFELTKEKSIIKTDDTTRQKYESRADGTQVRSILDKNGFADLQITTDKNGKVQVDDYANCGRIEGTVAANGDVEYRTWDGSIVSLHQDGSFTRNLDGGPNGKVTITESNLPDGSKGPTQATFERGPQIGDQNMQGTWARQGDTDNWVKVNADGKPVDAQGNVVEDPAKAQTFKGEIGLTDIYTGTYQVKSADGKFDGSYHKDGTFVEKTAVTNLPAGLEGKDVTQTRIVDAVMNQTKLYEVKDGDKSYVARVEQNGEVYERVGDANSREWTRTKGDKSEKFYGDISSDANGQIKFTDDLNNQITRRNTDGSWSRQLLQETRDTSPLGEVTTSNKPEYTVHGDKNGNITVFDGESRVYSSSSTQDGSKVTVDKETGDLKFTNSKNEEVVIHRDGSRQITAENGTGMRTVTDAGGRMTAQYSKGDYEHPTNEYHYRNQYDPATKQVRVELDQFNSEKGLWKRGPDVDGKQTWTLQNADVKEPPVEMKITKIDVNRDNSIVIQDGNTRRVEKADGSVITSTTETNKDDGSRVITTKVGDKDGKSAYELITKQQGDKVISQELTSGAGHFRSVGDNWVELDKNNKPIDKSNWKGTIAIDDSGTLIKRSTETVMENGQPKEVPVETTKIFTNGTSVQEFHKNGGTIYRDAEGDVTAKRDGTGQWTSFDYTRNADGTKQIDAIWENGEQWKWDKESQAFKSPDGKISFTEVTVNRKSGDVTHTDAAQSTTRQIDGTTRIQRNDGSVIVKDASDRPILVRNSTGQEVNYKYDAEGKVVRATGSDGSVIITKGEATADELKAAGEDKSKVKIAESIQVNSNGDFNTSYTLADKSSVRHFLDGKEEQYSDKNQLVRTSDANGNHVFLEYDPNDPSRVIRADRLTPNGVDIFVTNDYKGKELPNHGVTRAERIDVVANQFEDSYLTFKDSSGSIVNAYADGRQKTWSTVSTHEGGTRDVLTAYSDAHGNSYKYNREGEKVTSIDVQNADGSKYKLMTDADGKSYKVTEVPVQSNSNSGKGNRGDGEQQTKTVKQPIESFKLDEDTYNIHIKYSGARNGNQIAEEVIGQDGSHRAKKGDGSIEQLDGQNRVVYSNDGRGNELTTTYNADGSRTVKSGDNATSEYDSYGRLTSRKDATGKEYKFEYNQNVVLEDGKLRLEDSVATKFTEPDGKTWTRDQSVKPNGDSFTWVDADGKTKEGRLTTDKGLYSFTDKSGTSIKDLGDGRIETRLADGSSHISKDNRQISTTDASGRTTTFKYESDALDAKITGATVTDASGKVIRDYQVGQQYGTDKNGNPMTIDSITVWANRSTSINLKGEGENPSVEVIRHKSNGLIIQGEPGTEGQFKSITSVIQPGGKDELRVGSTTPDGTIKELKVDQSEKSRSVEVVLEKDGQRFTEVFTKGGDTLLKNGQGDVIRATSADGKSKLEYEYKVAKDPDGNPYNELSKVTRTTTDAKGDHVTTLTKQANGTWLDNNNNKYDDVWQANSTGRVYARSDASFRDINVNGTETITQYDNNGNISSRLEKNVEGQITSVTDSTGTVTRFERNEAGVIVMVQSGPDVLVRNKDGTWSSSLEPDKKLYTTPTVDNEGNVIWNGSNGTTRTVHDDGSILISRPEGSSTAIDVHGNEKHSYSTGDIKSSTKTEAGAVEIKMADGTILRQGVDSNTYDIIKNGAVTTKSGKLDVADDGTITVYDGTSKTANVYYGNGAQQTYLAQVAEDGRTTWRSTSGQNVTDLNKVGAFDPINDIKNGMQSGVVTDSRLNEGMGEFRTVGKGGWVDPTTGERVESIPGTNGTVQKPQVGGGLADIPPGSDLNAGGSAGGNGSQSSQQQGGDGATSQLPPGGQAGNIGVDIGSAGTKPDLTNTGTVSRDEAQSNINAGQQSGNMVNTASNALNTTTDGSTRVITVGQTTATTGTNIADRQGGPDVITTPKRTETPEEARIQNSIRKMEEAGVPKEKQQEVVERMRKDVEDTKARETFNQQLKQNEQTRNQEESRRRQQAESDRKDQETRDREQQDRTRKEADEKRLADESARRKEAEDREAQRVRSEQEAERLRTTKASEERRRKELDDAEKARLRPGENQRGKDTLPQQSGKDQKVNEDADNIVKGRDADHAAATAADASRPADATKHDGEVGGAQSTDTLNRGTIPTSAEHVGSVIDSKVAPGGVTADGVVDGGKVVSTGDHAPANGTVVIGKDGVVSGKDVAASGADAVVLNRDGTSGTIKDGSLVITKDGVAVVKDGVAVVNNGTDASSGHVVTRDSSGNVVTRDSSGNVVTQQGDGKGGPALPGQPASDGTILVGNGGKPGTLDRVGHDANGQPVKDGTVVQGPGEKPAPGDKSTNADNNGPNGPVVALPSTGPQDGVKHIPDGAKIPDSIILAKGTDDKGQVIGQDGKPVIVDGKPVVVSGNHDTAVKDVDATTQANKGQTGGTTTAPDPNHNKGTDPNGAVKPDPNQAKTEPGQAQVDNKGQTTTHNQTTNDPKTTDPTLQKSTVDPKTGTSTLPTDPKSQTPTDPKSQTPTDPKSQTPTDPKSQTPTDPKSQTPTDPKTQTPTDPKSQTPTDPKSQTPTDPKSQTPTDPKSQTPTDPKTTDPTLPKSSTDPNSTTTKLPTDPKSQTPTDPKSQTPADPKSQTPTDPKSQTPTDPKSQTPTDPKSQTPTDPKSQTPTDPKSQTPTDPKSQTPTDPKSQTPADPKSQTPTDPKSQTPTDPKSQTPTDPKSQTPTDPKTTDPTLPKSSTDPNSSTTKLPTDPKSQTPTDPKSQTPTDPKSQTPTDPKSQTPTTDPKSQTPNDPKSQTPTDPKSQTPTDPKSQTPTDPKASEPTLPKSQTPTDPKSQTPTDPKSQTPTDPKSQTPTDPKSQTPTDPKSQTPTDPKSQTPTDPKSQTPTDPKSQAPTDPKTSEPTLPKSQTPTDPKSQAPTDPKSQAPTDPKSQAPTDPKSQAPTDPKSQAPTDPKSQAPTDPKSQTPTDPKSQTPTDPKSQSTTDPKSQSTTDPKSQTSTDPKASEPTLPKSQTDPKSQAPTDPKSQTTTDPKAQAPADPKSQTSTDPKAQAPADPKSQTTTDPKAQAPADPKSQSSTDPKAQAPADPKSQSSTDPKSQSTTDPRASEPTLPKSQTSTDPKSQTSTDPKSQTSTDPKSQTSTNPKSQTSTDPKSQTSTTDPKSPTSTAPTDPKATEPTLPKSGSSTQATGKEPQQTSTTTDPSKTSTQGSTTTTTEPSKATTGTQPGTSNVDQKSVPAGTATSSVDPKNAPASSTTSHVDPKNAQTTATSNADPKSASTSTASGTADPKSSPTATTNTSVDPKAVPTGTAGSQQTSNTTLPKPNSEPTPGSSTNTAPAKEATSSTTTTPSTTKSGTEPSQSNKSNVDPASVVVSISLGTSEPSRTVQTTKSGNEPITSEPTKPSSATSTPSSTTTVVRTTEPTRSTNAPSEPETRTSEPSSQSSTHSSSSSSAGPQHSTTSNNNDPANNDPAPTRQSTQDPDPPASTAPVSASQDPDKEPATPTTTPHSDPVVAHQTQQPQQQQHVQTAQQQPSSPTGSLSLNSVHISAQTSPSGPGIQVSVTNIGGEPHISATITLGTGSASHAMPSNTVAQTTTQGTTASTPGKAPAPNAVSNAPIQANQGSTITVSGGSAAPTPNTGHVVAASPSATPSNVVSGIANAQPQGNQSPGTAAQPAHAVPTTTATTSTSAPTTAAPTTVASTATPSTATPSTTSPTAHAPTAPTTTTTGTSATTTSSSTTSTATPHAPSASPISQIGSPGSATGAVPTVGQGQQQPTISVDPLTGMPISQPTTTSTGQAQGATTGLATDPTAATTTAQTTTPTGQTQTSQTTGQVSATGQKNDTDAQATETTQPATTDDTVATSGSDVVTGAFAGLGAGSQTDNVGEGLIAGAIAGAQAGGADGAIAGAIMGLVGSALNQGDNNVDSRPDTQSSYVNPTPTQSVPQPTPVTETTVDTSYDSDNTTQPTYTPVDATPAVTPVAADTTSGAVDSGISQNHGTLQVFDDGSKIGSYADGTNVWSATDGRVNIMTPDGNVSIVDGTLVTQPNGLVDIVDSVGNIIGYDLGAGGLWLPQDQHDLGDGWKYSQVNDATVYTDGIGTTVVQNNDGSGWSTGPDGYATAWTPDGSHTTFAPDGSYVTYFPDGKTERHNPDGSIETYEADGSISTIDPTINDIAPTWTDRLGEALTQTITREPSDTERMDQIRNGLVIGAESSDPVEGAVDGAINGLLNTGTLDGLKDGLISGLIGNLLNGDNDVRQPTVGTGVTTPVTSGNSIVPDTTPSAGPVAGPGNVASPDGMTTVGPGTVFAPDSTTTVGPNVTSDNVLAPDGTTSTDRPTDATTDLRNVWTVTKDGEEWVRNNDAAPTTNPVIDMTPPKGDRFDVVPDTVTTTTPSRTVPPGFDAGFQAGSNSDDVGDGAIKGALSGLTDGGTPADTIAGAIGGALGSLINGQQNNESPTVQTDINTPITEAPRTESGTVASNGAGTETRIDSTGNTVTNGTIDNTAPRANVIDATPTTGTIPTTDHGPAIDMTPGDGEPIGTGLPPTTTTSSSSSQDQTSSQNSSTPDRIVQDRSNEATVTRDDRLPGFDRGYQVGSDADNVGEGALNGALSGLLNGGTPADAITGGLGGALGSLINGQNNDSPSQYAPPQSSYTPPPTSSDSNYNDAPYISPPPPTSQPPSAPPDYSQSNSSTPDSYQDPWDLAYTQQPSYQPTPEFNNPPYTPPVYNDPIPSPIDPGVFNPVPAIPPDNVIDNETAAPHPMPIPQPVPTPDAPSYDPNPPSSYDPYNPPAGPPSHDPYTPPSSNDPGQPSDPGTPIVTDPTVPPATGYDPTPSTPDPQAPSTPPVSGDPLPQPQDPGQPKDPSNPTAGLPIDPATGLPYDPYTGKVLDPVSGQPIGDYQANQPTPTQPTTNNSLPDPVDTSRTQPTQQDSTIADASRQPDPQTQSQPDPKDEQKLDNKQHVPVDQKDETRIEDISHGGVESKVKDPDIMQQLADEIARIQDTIESRLEGLQNNTTAYSPTDSSEPRPEHELPNRSDAFTKSWEEQREQEIQKRIEEERARRKEQEDELRQQKEEIKEVTDKLMAILATRRKEEVERIRRTIEQQRKIEEFIAKDNKVVHHQVKAGETIETIAKRYFKDPRVAKLIYDLNTDKITIKIVDGKTVYDVKPGVTLTLPSPRQVREWTMKSKMGMQTDQGQIPHATVTAEQRAEIEKRKENIEKVLGIFNEAAVTAAAQGIQYNVRFGDTLRSIAIKHPMLNDVTLWRLVAEKNGLSTDVDQSGVPIAVISRGDKIVLPTKDEISEFRKKNGVLTQSTSTWMVGQQSKQNGPVSSRTSKKCDDCQRLVPAGVSMCPGCGNIFGTVSAAKSLKTILNMMSGTTQKDGVNTKDEDSDNEKLPDGVRTDEDHVVAPAVPVNTSEDRTVITTPGGGVRTSEDRKVIVNSESDSVEPTNGNGVKTGDLNNDEPTPGVKTEEIMPEVTPSKATRHVTPLSDSGVKTTQEDEHTIIVTPGVKTEQDPKLPIEAPAPARPQVAMSVKPAIKMSLKQEPVSSRTDSTNLDSKASSKQVDTGSLKADSSTVDTGSLKAETEDLDQVAAAPENAETVITAQMNGERPSRVPPFAKMTPAMGNSELTTSASHNLMSQISDLHQKSRAANTSFTNLDSQEDSQSIEKFTEQLSASCRLVQTDTKRGGKNNTRLQLETLREERWVAVIAYEIASDKAIRHEYSLSGKTKTIKMDLPPGALDELVQNDLTRNWKSYCDKFLAGKKLSG